MRYNKCSIRSGRHTPRHAAVYLSRCATEPTQTKAFCLCVWSLAVHGRAAARACIDSASAAGGVAGELEIGRVCGKYRT